MGQKVTVTYKQLFFITLFVSFFSVSHLALNPVYLLSFFMILIYIAIVFLVKKLKISVTEVVIYCVILMLSVSQYFALLTTLTKFREVNILSPALLIYSILLGAISYNVGISITKSARVSVYSKILKFLVFFLIVEMLSRIIIFRGNTGDFYAFKRSFFYFDSNFTGLVILNFLFFYYYLSLKGIFYFKRSYRILLWALLILTFSRSSIIVGIVLYFLLLRAGRMRAFVIVCTGAYGIYQMISMVQYYISGGRFLEIDGSFNSKFYILDMFLDFYSELNLYEKATGIGMGNLAFYLDIFAHNIIVTFIAELGIIGTIILMLYFLYTLIKSNYYTSFILLPTFIAGLSLFSAYSPFLFVLLTLILIEEKSNIETPNSSYRLQKTP